MFTCAPVCTRERRLKEKPDKGDKAAQEDLVHVEPSKLARIDDDANEKSI
ncbi:MAG: hypothetical protein AB1512_25290 [Thermodesulfobacteriota bacterium]